MIEVAVPDVEVIDEAAVAVAMLDPLRARVLSALREPGSATTVAAMIGESRQKVNYHVRALEQLGLVRLVEDRPRRGLTERVMVASARAYLLSPEVLGECAADPRTMDRLSSSYLLALAARAVREVGELARRSEEDGRPLATLAIDTEIRFASIADRTDFARDLAAAITELAARYHDEQSPNGRWHRVTTLAHLRPPITPEVTT